MNSSAPRCRPVCAPHAPAATHMCTYAPPTVLHAPAPPLSNSSHLACGRPMQCMAIYTIAQSPPQTPQGESCGCGWQPVAAASYGRASPDKYVYRIEQDTSDSHSSTLVVGCCYAPLLLCTLLHTRGVSSSSNTHATCMHACTHTHNIAHALSPRMSMQACISAPHAICCLHGMTHRVAAAVSSSCCCCSHQSTSRQQWLPD